MKKLPKGTYKAAKKYLESNFPDKKAEAILDATTHLYNEFIEETPAPGGLNILRKQYYGGLSVFAFYEVMNREISEDVLQDILWSMLLSGRDINKKKNIHMNLNNQLIQMVGYGVISRYAKYVNNKADSGKWKNVWKIKSNSYNRKNGICMPLLNCPVARFAKKHGYEHLMPLFCGSDFKVAEKYGLKLIRTHTEAEGYSDCDFWYLNKDSEEI